MYDKALLRTTDSQYNITPRDVCKGEDLEEIDNLKIRKKNIKEDDR
jgi:hypothetical protein